MPEKPGNANSPPDDNRTLRFNVSVTPALSPVVSGSRPNQIIIKEEGIEVSVTRSFGCGIDCHRLFIQVSVIVRRNLHTFEYRKEFKTDWNSLLQAKEWAVNVVTTCSDPVPDLASIPWHYCIESTGCYHISVCLAWQGTPCIVNPSIAGAAKKKTDVVDAKGLAIQDLLGIWRVSYIPSLQMQELRVLLAEQENYTKMATRTSNRINTTLLKFGYTQGREGSVTGSSVRTIIEDQISDHPVLPYDNLPPDRIPQQVRDVLKVEYGDYDYFHNLAHEYMTKTIEKAASMDWETDTGTIPGKEMVRILTTAPGVGVHTAVVWLSNIMTPRRFPNAKALVAYCGLDPSLKISAGKVTSTKKRGGCKAVHKELCQDASRLMGRHTEAFGKWGYNIYQQTGKWKKGTNAVGRKLAIALYYMMKRGEPFSYEKYTMMKHNTIMDIPTEHLAILNPSFKRYVRILAEHGITTTSVMTEAYYECRLKSMRGLGRKFFACVRDFLDNQAKYKALYSQSGLFEEDSSAENEK